MGSAGGAESGHSSQVASRYALQTRQRQTCSKVPSWMKPSVLRKRLSPSDV